MDLWHLSVGLCNILLMHHALSKILRQITDAPWFVSNKILHDGLDILVELIDREIKQTGVLHFLKLEDHRNYIVAELFEKFPIGNDAFYRWQTKQAAMPSKSGTQWIFYCLTSGCSKGVSNLEPPIQIL